MRSMLPSTPAAADSHCTSKEAQAEEHCIEKCKGLATQDSGGVASSGYMHRDALRQYMHSGHTGKESLKCSSWTTGLWLKQSLSCSLAAPCSDARPHEKEKGRIYVYLGIPMGNCVPRGRLRRKQMIPTELHEPYSTLCSKPW